MPRKLPRFLKKRPASDGVVNVPIMPIAFLIVVRVYKMDARVHLNFENERVFYYIRGSNLAFQK